MLLTICDARHEGHRHGPRSSIVRSLFSSQKPFGVLSVLANLSRHNTFRDSKCFHLKQKYPRKRILSLLHPKTTTTHQSENEKKAVKTFLFFKVMFSEMCIFSTSNGVSAVLVWSGWYSQRIAAFVKAEGNESVVTVGLCKCDCTRAADRQIYFTLSTAEESVQNRLWSQFCNLI